MGQERKHALQWLSRSQLAAQEPALTAPGSGKLIYLPEVWQVRSPALVRAACASIRQRGILVSEHQPVVSLKVRKRQIQGVRVGNQSFAAGKVVMTTGAWSGQFPELAELAPGLRVCQEQLIVLRDCPELLQHMLVQHGQYMVPRRDGRIVCGAVRSTEFADKTLTETARQQLQNFAARLLPELRGLAVRNHWAALHACAPKNLPYVGRHPDIKGLYCNFGHGVQGMAIGLATVQIVVDRILKQENALGLKACHIES
ncbi:MAG: FAD-dependent oxidoreductase [Thiolinea sp.]